MEIRSAKKKKRIGFVQIPHIALEYLAKHLTGNQFKVYLMLVKHRNNQTRLCYPAIPKIAKETNLSEPTIKRIRKRLKKLGLISWKRERTKRKSCFYGLTFSDAPEIELANIIANLKGGSKVTCDKVTHDRGSKVTCEGGSKVTPKQEELNKKKLTTTREDVVVDFPFSGEAMCFFIQWLLKKDYGPQEIEELTAKYPGHLLAGWVYYIARKGAKVEKPKHYLGAMLGRGTFPEVDWRYLAKYFLSDKSWAEAMSHGKDEFHPDNYPEVLLDRIIAGIGKDHQLGKILVELTERAEEDRPKKWTPEEVKKYVKGIHVAGSRSDRRENIFTGD